MKVTFHISESDQKQFVRACEVAITSVGYGTKSGITEAAQEIMMESMNQVPRKTGTLAKSAFAGVSRRTDLKTYKYGAVLGYGQYQGVGSLASLGSQAGGIEWIWAPTNPKNPKSNLPASVYATKVHENLTYKHPNGGKAKFLEDPVRAWSAGRFERTIAEYWRTAIERTYSLVQTNLSNRELQQALKWGKLVDPEVPTSPMANKSAYTSTEQFFKDLGTYEHTARASAAYKSIRDNPTRGSRKSGKRTNRWIAVKGPTKYTPQRQSSQTWRK